MDASIASESLAFYAKFSERDTRVDFEKGQEDGRAGYPLSSDDTFSTYEMYRISEARAAVNHYVRRMRAAFDDRDRQIGALITQRDDDYASRKRLLNEQKRAKLNHLSAIAGPSSPEHQTLERTLQEKKSLYKDQEFESGRSPRLSMHQPIFDRSWLGFLSPYAGILLFLAVLEIPINVLAVELAFGFTPPLSYVIAFLIGLAFIMTAHFTGLQALRVVSAKGWLKLWHAALMLLSLLLAAFMILILFEMRGQVSQFLGGGLTPEDLLSGAQPGQATQPGDARPIWERLLVDPLTTLFGSGDPNAPLDDTRFAQIGLLLLNSLVFVIGLVLSIIRHDPDPHLERAYQNMASAERALNRYMKQYRKRYADHEAQFDHQIAKVERKADQINEEIQSLDRERYQLERQIVNDVRMVTNVLRMQITAYQQGNRSARSDDPPAYFGRRSMERLNGELVVE